MIFSVSSQTLYTLYYFMMFLTIAFLLIFIKKIGEVFIKNFMILTPLFFGKKHLTEALTEKIVENFLTGFKELAGLSSFSFAGLTPISFFNFFCIFFILLFNTATVTYFNFIRVFFSFLLFSSILFIYLLLEDWIKYVYMKFSSIVILPVRYFIILPVKYFMVLSVSHLMILAVSFHNCKALFAFILYFLGNWFI